MKRFLLFFLFDLFILILVLIYFSIEISQVVLETELKNVGAMALYENLGFTRDKRLYRYYLNGGDAFRLKLWLK